MSESRRSTSKVVRKYAIPVAVLVLGLPIGIGVMMAMGSAPEDKNPVFTRVSGDNSKFAPEAQPRWEPVKTLMGSAATADDVRHRARRLAVADHMGLRRRTPAHRRHRRRARVRARRQRLPARRREDRDEHRRAHAEDRGRRAVARQGRAAGPRRARGAAAGGHDARPPRWRPGSCIRVQRKARGTVSVYKLANGRLALRFEDFYTTGSPGLDIWLSHARKPTSTLQARDAKHYNAGALRSTLGSYNQVLPKGASLDGVKSIVIWCPTVTIAFGAAALGV